MNTIRTPHHHRFFPGITQVSLVFSLLLGLAAVSSHAHSDEDPVHHWEMPSNDPDRIVLTLPGDPSTTAAVTWRTSTETKTGILQIAEETGSPNFDEASISVEASLETVGFPESIWNHSFEVNYHSATVSNLKPDTLYSYRVGDGNQFWSEWIQFRTASDRKETPVTFLYFGDAQNSIHSHWSRVIRGAFKMAPNASFSLHAGDLINRAHHDTEWAEWFHAGSWIHASVASVPVAGNHEYSSKTGDVLDLEKFLSMHWCPQFNLPLAKDLPEDLSETVYTVEYPNMLVVVLNSNREREAQIQWLQKKLETNTRKWVILSFHHPIFSSGKDRDNKEERDLWKPVFDKYSVDLVLQGHDHTYARGQTPQVPVHLTDKKEHSETINTVYVNSVSGPKMYDFMSDGWDGYANDGVSLLRRAENTQFFQVITVSSNEIDYKAYTALGELYDAFRILKSDDGTKIISQVADITGTKLFLNTQQTTKVDN